MLIRMKNINSKDITNQVNWLHDEVINSFMFYLTNEITDTIYCASSKGLLIAYGKSFDISEWSSECNK